MHRQLDGLTVMGCAVCRPVHPQIRRVKDWIEVEEALALLGTSREAKATA